MRISHEMKRYGLLLVSIVLLSCSERIVAHSDFDKGVEIHRLPNYAWLLNNHVESSAKPLIYNELNDKRIKSAVNEQMKMKGYIEMDTLAQIILHYHIVIEKGTVVRTEPLGYHAGFLGSINNIESYNYKEGTLIIDFMKADTKELIWRGWAQSILNDDGLVTEDLIQEAVIKIFKAFPESAQKEVTEF